MLSLFKTFWICVPMPRLSVALKKRILNLNTRCRKSGLNILFLYFKCQAYFLPCWKELEKVMNTKQVFQTLPHVTLGRQTDSPAPKLPQLVEPILLCNTVSTPDASGSTKYYRTHYNQWHCLHWMWHWMWHDKSLTVTAVVFYLWHIDTNFKWFSTVALSRPV